ARGGPSCERNRARHGSEAPDEHNHVAARGQQVVRFDVESVVAGARADREPPSEQRGGGRNADTDAAGARHVQESPGFPGQRRRRGGHDRAVVGRDEQPLADSENREGELTSGRLAAAPSSTAKSNTLELAALIRVLSQGHGGATLITRGSAGPRLRCRSSSYLS